MLRANVICLAVWLCASGASLAQTDPASGATYVWTGPQAGKAFADLIEAVEAAASHGLDPDHYGLQSLIAADPGEPDPELDRFATDVYFALAGDLLNGRIAEGPGSLRWFAPARHRDLAAHLSQSLSTGRVADSLDALAPGDPEYHALRNELARLHALAKGEAWPDVEPGPALRPGDAGPRVAQLRARLEAMGAIAAQEPVTADGDAAVSGAWAGEPPASDHAAAPAPPAAVMYDAEFEAAVRRIQRAARLREDGIAGVETLAWINTPIDRRMARIAANLERWRWLEDDPGDPHIRVFIPDFRLQVYAGGVSVREHDVIVGRRTRPTPVLNAAMRYVIANPWWETPHRLAVQDELPLFRRDPDAVTRLGFHIIDRATGEAVDPATIDWHAVSASDFPYRLRQAPGPLNALGEVKLIFPNPHNAYLHDTPSRRLFDENVRAFSSGCVRVREAVDLAEWVIQAGAGEQPQALRDAVASGLETRVDLARPIPVHFLYMTAVADGTGGARLVADIYNQDDALIAAMRAPRPIGAPRHETRPDQLALSGVDECSAAL